MKPVLICGGVGKKMWPLSRRSLPKHFLKLFSGKSLFQINYENLRLKFSPQEIFIQTNREQAKVAKQQCPEIPPDNFFIEPETRDQGPATGFMAAKLYKNFPDEPFMVVQADVLREPAEGFIKMIDQCDVLARKSQKLITGGLRPEYAIMGIDYLKVGPRVEEIKEMNIFLMEAWLGRNTDEKIIKELVKEKSVLGHTNHYVWTPRLMLAACQKWAPDWYEHLQKILNALGTSSEEKTVQEEYSHMEKTGIERITQHALKEGYVVELPFQWTDFGTWESFARYQISHQKYLPDDETLTLGSPDCFIQKEKDKFVALIGVKNLVVVEANDGLLICDRAQTGKVEEIISYLKEKGKEKYL